MGKGNSHSIFITGANGFVGSSLSAKLKDPDAILIELSRKGMVSNDTGTIVVKGDLFEPRLLYENTPSFDTLVHLAWVNSLEKNQQIRGKDGSTLNIFALKNILKIAESKGCRRIIFLSMVGAKKDSKDFYLREKYQAEHLIINSMIPEKCILRSPFVYAPEQSNYFLLSRLWKISKYPFVIPLPERWPHIELILRSELIDQIVNQVFLKDKRQETEIVDLAASDLETWASLKEKIPEFVHLVRKKWVLKGALGERFLLRMNRKHFIFS